MVREIMRNNGNTLDASQLGFIRLHSQVLHEMECCVFTLMKFE